MIVVWGRLRIRRSREPLTWHECIHVPSVEWFISAVLLPDIVNDKECIDLTQWSQIQSLWSSFILAIQHIFLWLSKIFTSNLHSPFSESHETSLSTDCLSVRQTVVKHYILQLRRLYNTLISAPERSSLAVIYSSRSRSSANVIFFVWIWNIRRRVFSSGSGNSIFRSIRPK